MPYKTPNFTGFGTNTITVGTIESQDATSVQVNLGDDAGDDFVIDTNKLVVEGDTGNVGIGTAAPGSQLEIQDTTTSSANTGGALRLSANDGSPMGDSHRLGVIEFTGAEDSSNTQVVGARIEALTDAAWTNVENGTALYFYTTDSNAAQTNVLKIDSNKKSTFAGNIEVTGSSGDLIFEMDNNASNSSNFQIQNGAGNTRTDFVLDGNNHLTMKSQRVAIVGTNPQKTLDVTGDGQFSTDLTVGGDLTINGGDIIYGNGQNAAITVTATGSGTDGKDLQIEAGSAPAGSANQNGGDLVLKAGGGDGTGTSAITFATKVSGTDAAAERMRLHTNGYLGVGTNAPSQLIHASGADPILVIQNSTAENTDGGCDSKVIFADHAANALATIEGSHSGSSDDSKGQFRISTDNGSGTQLAMSIDDAQVTTFAANVVVGGTTPKITIGDGGTEDTMLVFDGNAADYRIGIDDGTDTLEIGKGSAHGTTPVIKIDSSTNCQVMHNSAVADGEYSGDLAMFTAGEDLTAGEVCYFKSDGKMWKAVATAEATARCVAMSVATTSADAMGPFLLKGFARFNSEFPSYTVGGALYTPEAETSSKNVPEQAAPDTDGDFVQVIGFAVSADAVYFDPDSTVIEVA